MIQQFHFQKNWKPGLKMDNCTPTFIAPLFTIYTRWKQPKCPVMGEWVNKVWCIHSMEYYRTLWRGSFWHMLGHGWTLTVMINEMSPSQKDKYCTSPLPGRTLGNQTHTKIDWWMPEPEGRSYWGVTVYWVQNFGFIRQREFWRRMLGVHRTTMWTYLPSVNWTLKAGWNGTFHAVYVLPQ